MLPWCRRYTAGVVAASDGAVSAGDAWDEVVAALLRADAHFKPGAGTFAAYAQRAVVRGLWRYVRRPARRVTVALEDLHARAWPRAASAEDVVAACEAVAMRAVASAPGVADGARGHRVARG